MLERKVSAIERLPLTVVGLGLFAQRDFPCGTVVTRMVCPTCITTTTPRRLFDWWEAHTQQADIPKDCAIFVRAEEYGSQYVHKRNAKA